MGIKGVYIMRTKEYLKEMIQSYSLPKINGHIHTHLCDGQPVMTVENIAKEAEKEGFELIILTPHFHQQVSDGMTTLYHDTDEMMILKLRDEIDTYEKKVGKIKILLSTEADILNVQGNLSVKISKEVEEALDLVTPTINYHPLLPLETVAATDIKKADEYHMSGRYREIFPEGYDAGYILETYYETAKNAILNCEYPAMLGHFFAPHSIAGEKHSWFELDEAYLPMMKKCTEDMLLACAKKKAMLDITGIHFMNGITPREQAKKDGFLYEFQKFTLQKCREYDVPFCAGSDAHNLPRIAECKLYEEIFEEYI